MGNQVHHYTTGTFNGGASSSYTNEGGFPNNNTGNSSITAASVTIDDSSPNGKISPNPNLKIFSFAELKRATRNFRADSVLGVGGFGTVYKGNIHVQNSSTSKIGSGIMVAIKKLSAESFQGLEEWESEVNFLGRLSHPNIIKLFGYCCQNDKELLLVYEFMQNGSLEHKLYPGGSEFKPLSWDIRLKIAIGAARGLDFLHSSEKQVIYRDVKTSNILLDENYIAKLSDFGLAKYGPLGNESDLETRVMGTYGYAAPEYLATGKLNAKCDVYGFGVVLLEMLTGQRVIDRNRPYGKMNLVKWSMSFLSNTKKLACIIDPRLEGKGNYPSEGALNQAANLILTCLDFNPEVRPSMKEVLEALERIEAIKSESRESQTNYTKTISCHSHNQDTPHHQAPIQPNHKKSNSALLPIIQNQSSSHRNGFGDEHCCINPYIIVDDGGNEVGDGRLIRRSLDRFGEPAIFFLEEDVVAGASKFRFALVGKLCRSHQDEGSTFRLDIEAIRKAMAGWNLLGSCEVIAMDYRHVLLNFSIQIDMISIWVKERIELDGFFMRVFKWTAFFRPSDKDPSVVPGWVSFPNLPLFCYEEKNLKSIASVVGEVIAIDQATKKGTRLDRATVCVLMDLLKDYPKRVWIGCGVDGFWQTIDYASLPDYCKLCSQLGHTQEDCMFKGKAVDGPKAPDLLKQEWIPKEKPLVINERTDVRINAKKPIESGILKGLEIFPDDEDVVDLGQSSFSSLDSRDVLCLSDEMALGIYNPI